MPGAKRVVPAGMAIDKKGDDLFVCGLWADALVRIPLDNPKNPAVISLEYKEPEKPMPPKGEPPSPDDGRKKPEEKKEVKAAAEDEISPVKGNGYPTPCYSTPRASGPSEPLGKSAVAVVDLETNKLAGIWTTASHPTEMLLDPKGKACTSPARTRRR